MRRISGAFVVLLLVLGAGRSVEAQNPNYIFRFPPDLGGASGSVITVSYLLDVLPGASPLQGWSLGVCHDWTKVRPVAIAQGAIIFTVKNGQEADFHEINFYAGDATISGGAVQGVVICFIGCATLPPGNGYEVLVVDYELLAPNGTIATLNYCDNAGIPGGAPPTPTIVVANGGVSITPTKQPGPIDIDIIPFILSCSSAASVPQGDTASVSVSLANSLPVYGFSFGMTHSAASLAIDSVEQGAALIALNPPDGADFFGVSTAPSGGTGYTVGAVFSLSSALALPPGGPGEIVSVDYSVLPSAPLGTTPLNFTSSLSPPSPAPPVPIVVSIGEDTVTPQIVAGSVTVVFGGVTFRRGDINNSGPGLDLADPISLLAYMFNGGATPVCLDTGDLNDNGVIDLSDPIYLLAYQFSGGQSPAAPFPQCGVDPTVDTITCTSFSSCP